MSGRLNCKTAYGEKCPAFPYEAGLNFEDKGLANSHFGVIIHG